MSDNGNINQSISEDPEEPIISEEEHKLLDNRSKSLLLF